MATITPVTPDLDGEQFSPTAAAGGGDQFANTGSERFYIKNGDASSHDVTFDCPNACSFGVTNAAHDVTVSVPAGEEYLIGPFPKGRFNDVNGFVQVTYSAVTSVTVGVIKP